jgi:SAM-dependent methyltransferase
MRINRLLAAPRILWRDAIMRLSDATLWLDELMAAYLFADAGYQYTWSRLDVHRTLLADKVRVDAFKRALDEAVKPGDRVLDVGTGSGILAMLAAKAGAGHVVGVDSASIIDVASRTAARNRLANVEFLRADIRDVRMEKFDLIICELIGLYVTDEGLAYKMDIARGLLKEGGRLMPSRLDVHVAPVESADAGLGFWGDLYGIDYRAVDSVPHEARNYDMSGCRLLAAPKLAFTIDLAKKSGPLTFSGDFKAESDGEFHGFVMYWEAKLSDGVTLSTDPRSPQTHWKQVFFPHPKRVRLSAGDFVGCELASALNGTKWRWEFRPSKLNNAEAD